MLVEQFSHPVELQRTEEKLQQLRIGVRRGLIHLLLNQAYALLECAQQRLGQHVTGLVRCALLFVQRIPLPVQTVQRRGQPGRLALAQCLQLALIKAGAVHAAASIDQVMGLVHQYRSTPLVGLGQAEEQGVGIEIVVVVGNQYIDPARHFLPQVIRAHLVGQCHCAQAAAVEQGLGSGGFTCGGEPVVEARRQRA